MPTFRFFNLCFGPISMGRVSVKPGLVIKPEAQTNISAVHAVLWQKTPGSRGDFQAAFGQVRSGQVSTVLAKATEQAAGHFPSWIS